MVRRGQAGLFVCIAHGTEEAANDLEVCLELAIVCGLFEHAQVEVRWWRKRATGYENKRLLLIVREHLL